VLIRVISWIVSLFQQPQPDIQHTCVQSRLAHTVRFFSRCLPGPRISVHADFIFGAGDNDSKGKQAAPVRSMPNLSLIQPVVPQEY
jgi:hypothetical protein